MSAATPLAMKKNSRDATMFLLEGESSPPDAVQRAESFIKNLGIWFEFSRNDEARTCPDAARKRNRLGHTGIPLWDEMKSFFGWYVHRSGKTQLFLAHCRADQKLNSAKLSGVLKAKVAL